MKQGRTDRDWAVVAVMAFVAGAGLAWALLSKHPPQPRPPIDIDWPAWVQAIGSILAILTAIYVPTIIERNKRAEVAMANQRALRRFLSIVLPLLRDVSRKLATYASQIDYHHDEDDVLNVAAMDGEYEDDARQIEVLLNSAPDLLDFTEAFSDFQVHMANIKYWNSNILDHMAGGLHHAWQRDKDFVQAAAAKASSAAERIAERIVELTGLHVQSMFDDDRPS